MIKKEFHIPIPSVKKSAVEYLSQASGLSQQKIKQAMQKGCVWLERSDGDNSYVQRLRRAKKVLKENDILHMYYNQKVLDVVPKEAELIFDAGDYSIWNKPSGMLSQGSKWGDHCTIYRWAENKIKPQRNAFIVHRLDRAANGLMILAHKKKIAAYFSNLFKEHKLEKIYRATVVGDVSTTIGDHDNLLIDDPIDGKPAISVIRLLDIDKKNKTSKLDVSIKSGRKHQIRKHLLGIGHPIVGDRLYGVEPTESDLQLSAYKLSFICPISNMQQSFTLG